MEDNKELNREQRAKAREAESLERRKIGEDAARKSIMEMASLCQDLINDKRYEAFKMLLDFGRTNLRETLAIVAKNTDGIDKFSLQASFISGRLYELDTILDIPGRFIKQYNEYLGIKNMEDREGEKHDA